MIALGVDAAPDIDTREDALSVRYRWHRSAALGPGVAALVGLALVPVFVLDARLVSAAVLGVAALGFAYVAATALKNSTHIEVGKGRLKVHHGPLPWPGVELDTAALEQLWVRPRAGLSRRIGGRAVAQKRTFHASYDLVALDKEGRVHTLASGFQDRLGAQSIEDAIEDFLAIVDVPMPDEAPKDRD